MAKVTVHYWAGARAAAEVEWEVFEAGCVADALAQAKARRADPRFDQIVTASSLLIDGAALSPEGLVRGLLADTTVEVLPPFAGGALNSNR